MIEATLGVWDTNLLSHAIPGRSRHALYQSVTDLGQVTTAAPVVEEWIAAHGSQPAS